MKKCPFCAEDIQDEAIKCKHCGEFLEPAKNPRLAETKEKWYLRKSFIFIAIACVGPLALPLIWMRPNTSKAWKVGLTIGVVVFTWIIYHTTMEYIRVLSDYYNLLEGM